MYYMFGFIMLAFLVLLVVCAQTSILLCYFHLCSEDYRWWWRSFFSTGMTGFYLFLFSVYYFLYKTTITGGLSYILYFGYTFIVVFLFFLMTGGCVGVGVGGGGDVGIPPLFLACGCFCRVHWVPVLHPVRAQDLFHRQD